MEYIGSKNICQLIRETLKLLDERPMEAGARTSYIVYKMLMTTELFEEFEIAELCYIAMLRDIGAYKTDKIDDMMAPGFERQMPHALYGYLFVKNLFPVSAYGKILLYHHMDYEQMAGVSYEFDFMSDYIHLADDINMFLLQDKDTFDYHVLEAGIGTKYEDKTYHLFEEAQQKYHILEELKGVQWKEELLQLLEYIIFRNDEKKKYLEMLMYCYGFKSEAIVVDTVATICIAYEIGGRLGLDEEELKLLYYGTMLHNIGMLGIEEKESDITYPLDEKSIKIIKKHIELEEELLRKRFKNQQVVDIAVRHHERLDGSGYPKGLKAADMTILDRILQTADVAASLISTEKGRIPHSKEQVGSILRKECEAGKLGTETVKIFLENYDEICRRVRKESGIILSTYRRLQSQFEKASVKLQQLQDGDGVGN